MQTTRKMSLVLIAAAATVATTIDGAHGQTAGEPLRLSAWAVNMSNVATGTNAVMDIRITRWSTPKDQPRTVGYPFTFLQIHLDKNGEGEGRMAVATKLSFDKKKKNAVELENYSSEPVRLQRVKVEKD